MKPIIFRCSKQNLVFGISIAILLIIFIKCITNKQCLNKIFNDKYHKTKVLEPFLANPINKINSICSIPYNNKTLTKPPTLPTFKPPSISSKPPSISSKPLSIVLKKTPAIIPQPSSNINLNPKVNTTCRLGVNIEPPSENSKQALTTLITPITPNQIKEVEQVMLTKPEFNKVLNSDRKDEMIKEIIILNKLVSEPSDTLSQDDINHLATIILSDINTVDRPLASIANAFYSTSAQIADSNPFAAINTIPIPDIKLDDTSIKILLSEPITELTPETEAQIVSLFKKIKIDMPYDKCVDMLTEHNKLS